MIEKEQCFKHRNKIYDDIVSFAYKDCGNPGIKNTYHCTLLKQANGHEICKGIL